MGEADPPRKKKISVKEKAFAKCMYETGLGGVEAARVSMGWQCEPNSAENDKARNLARTPRVKEEMARLEAAKKEASEGKTHKRLAPKEMHFAKLIAEREMDGPEAARIAFAWRCDPDSRELSKAISLAKSPRVLQAVAKLKAQEVRELEVQESLRVDFGEMHKGDLREYAFKVLEKMRDNPDAKSADRFNAIKMLKKLHDPGKDVNLIYKWIDLAWRYQTGHCPACHTDFSMSSVTNAKLDEWRAKAGADKSPGNIPRHFDRQMEIIKRCDPRRTPHEGQVRILSAPERHVVGEGAARSGKSYLLALIAAMGVCLPGVEIWILAQTFDRASKEVEYLQSFLNALFFPYYKQMVSVVHDKKTGEMVLTTKWGSEVRVKSAKAKGSITGHALEYALCAEPGWLPPDIYEELRARMSERLGRIIALGTPKGTAGFIGRLTKMSGRDPSTGKLIRWKPEDRLIANDCPWGISMLVTRMSPTDNPEYVKAELDAARYELTDEEYASEFEGVGVSAEGRKFALVRDDHLKQIDQEFFERSSFVLGIDQGAKNFAAALIAFDGRDIVTCWEFYNGSDRTTMKKNLVTLRARVPRWIESVGGDPNNWALTITDQDPMLDPIFVEMEEEGQPWFTEIVKRHRNMAKLGENWRRENAEFVNNMARDNAMLFHLNDIADAPEDESPGGYLIHDQVMQVHDIPDDQMRESKSGDTKGWVVSDPFRGDHVLDAWYLAVWTICSQQVSAEKNAQHYNPSDPWGSQKSSFEANFAAQESRELGKSSNKNVQDAWRSLLHGSKRGPGGFGGNYNDA